MLRTVLVAQFNSNIQTISDPKSKGVDAKRVDFTSKTESRAERAWRLMRLCRCHPRGERICRVGHGSGAAHSMFQRNLTHFSTHYSAFIQLLTRWRERGGCPNINTLRTIPGTRIRDKKQWKWDRMGESRNNASLETSKQRLPNPLRSPFWCGKMWWSVDLDDFSTVWFLGIPLLERHKIDEETLHASEVRIQSITDWSRDRGWILMGLHACTSLFIHHPFFQQLHVSAINEKENKILRGRA